MIMVIGLRFVKREVKLPDGSYTIQRMLQQRLAEIWFQVESGTLVMKDKPLPWSDVEIMDDLNGN